MKGILKVAPIYTYDDTTLFLGEKNLEPPIPTPSKLCKPYYKSIFKFLTLGGCYTSRCRPKNSKTYGEGISSLHLTVFELLPKTRLLSHFLKNGQKASFLAITQKL